MLLRYYLSRQLNATVTNDLFIRSGNSVRINKWKKQDQQAMTGMFPIFFKFRRDRRKHNFNVVPYKRVKHYKYYLWLNKLPLRGQRTHTNAQTIKFSLIFSKP